MFACTCAPSQTSGYVRQLNKACEVNIREWLALAALGFRFVADFATSEADSCHNRASPLSNWWADRA